MTEYAISFARSARKELEDLSIALGRRIFSRIEQLGKDPRPPGCRKIQGASNLWRIRIGEYRVVYGIYDESQRVDIVAVRHRRDAYR
jgi:mRNA interferase RelE/StbE